MFSDAIKAEIVLWYAEKKSPTKVQRMFRAKYGKHRDAPKNTDKQRWTKTSGKHEHFPRNAADQEGLIDSKLSDALKKIQSSH